MASLNNSPNTAPPTSSPPLPSSPMVSTKKRVARTYGSKRVEAPPPDESPDADRSFGTLVDGDISISLSPAARSHGIDDNVVSSQDTKVDDDGGEKDNSPKQTKHQWSWMAALKELSDSDGEAESNSALPIRRHCADMDGSDSSPASRSRGVKSKGKRPSTSPKKPQRLPLTAIPSDSRPPARVSIEPEASGSDGDNSPSPSPPRQKRRTSGRRADTVIAEDSESEAPRASSSKRGNRLHSADMDVNDRASPDSAKQKRKTTAGRKPTAKVNCHDARHQEEEELKKTQARIEAERHVDFPTAKQPVNQYHISAFFNSFQTGMSAAVQKPPNHSSEPEDIQEWSSPVKQVVLWSKRKPALPPADIDDEIGLEILPPGVEESRPEPKSLLDRKQSPHKVRMPGQRPKDVGINKRQVNQTLLDRHNNQKSAIIQKKESAWKEKGGLIFKPLADSRASLGEYLERIESANQQQQVEDDEDASDEEYRPGHDNQSPRSGSPSDDDTENDPPPPFVPNLESTVESGGDTEEHDENVPPSRNPRATRTMANRTRINDSDDEGGNANSSRVLVPSTSLLDVQEHDAKSPTSISGGQDRQSLTPADGETDKENVDDNKENAATISSSRSAFSAFTSPRVWKAPASPMPSRQPQLFERPAPDVRSPLSELRTEDKDEDAFGSSHRRRLSTTSSSSFGAPPLPAPLFGAPAASDDDDELQPAPLARKGFSQLFGTAPGRSLTFGESPKKSPRKGGFDAFRKGDDEFGFSLSFDAELQPALEVSSTALRRADDIFQNEQEMIMQAAQASAKPKKPQLYIDENGFLTQSRPVGANPQLYYPTTQATPLTTRKPLGTLAVESPPIFSDPDDPGSPSPSKPARRLRRRGSDSSAPGGSPLSSHPPKRSAFEILAVVAQKAKEKKSLKKSEFVEAEAQESDEDDGFGFKKKTADDDEGDSDADDDKPVEGLVDDTVMDEATLAGKLVQEKFKEHQEQDDVQLEKQARDIVEGKKRAKRRGFDLGSDESGSEDEDADRRRRKSIKKPRLDDGKLEGIGGDVDPSAFLRAYNSNLEDDEPLFPADEDSQMAERDDEEGEDDGEPRETISTREIEAEIRKAAGEKKYDDGGSFDPSDTTFMDRDSDDDELPLRTRAASKRPSKVTRTRDAVDAMCFQSCLDDSQRSQEQLWLKNLGSSNLSGFYQGPSGGAVTAAGARAKGKSSRMVTKPSSLREERRNPAKEASMLVSALRKGKAC
ncbi:hypothetical protein BDM02DRAFT_3268545 [Thelephora ganbajun]|uniref:Uncharacterized protein n=1 Tax=Thelephora ganbajun TaxID=370292 RepID=A0ACB6ZJG0_THEGA|nr:hypothetical protein BDM02DRAFT_3268545 [Thelephora ganbajun]